MLGFFFFFFILGYFKKSFVMTNLTSSPARVGNMSLFITTVALLGTELLCNHY